MNFRILLIIVCVAVCAATLAGVVVQGRQLGELRAEHRRLIAQQEAAQEATTQVTLKTGPPARNTPSLELLRLRAEVNRLTNRRRELNSVTGENEKLLVQVAVNRTNSLKVSSIPPGYIRKSTARNVGYNTPEDTLETMMWSVQNRDLDSFMQTFTPEMAAEFQKKIESSNRTGKDFFKNSDSMPPMRVVERQQLPDGSMELKVEAFGEESPSSQKMLFRPINGQWKLEIPEALDASRRRLIEKTQKSSTPPGQQP